MVDMAWPKRMPTEQAEASGLARGRPRGSTGPVSSSAVGPRLARTERGEGDLLDRQGRFRAAFFMGVGEGRWGNPTAVR